MRRGRWTAAAGVAGLLVALVTGPPAAAGATAPGAAGAAADQPRQVTLLTGDRVLVRAAGGGQPALTVVPATRPRAVGFATYRTGGDWYVLPADAGRLVRSGQLDAQLFNVTGLLRAGLDDARSGTLPLIVRYADKAVTRRAPLPAGASVAGTLPALGMAAVTERKGDAPRFWAGLAGPQPRVLSGGLTRVWLDRKVRAALDVSAPQVHAPAAWQSGLTGAGVTVAVLDSGIDTDHPDLVDAVTQARDFTGKGNVEDGAGHGTHVASIITGSGAASAGRYRGVAPDATLAVGKVLDDEGWGSFSTVLSGMQWAATEAHARVVNMSLGGDPTDGTDPLSTAVDELTRQTGTLFVAAAGNFGSTESVGTPAAATEALAVASVNADDELSDFSSRGPRTGDGAAKPELAAPGGAIVAARPAGVEPVGEPVGEYYQRMPGTSMAAPHVAGAAAILAQQHPDWSADQLKPALLSTAEPVRDPLPFDVGTGRLDIARLISQPATAAPGSASILLRWPNLGVRAERTITYRNPGPADLSLSLSLPVSTAAGEPAPAGRLQLSAQQVTVPAGGQAQVTVAATGTPGQVGNYQGVLTARSGDGATVLRTAIALYQEAERYDLTVDLLDHDGNPPADEYAGYVYVTDLATGEMWWQFSGETVRLPAGRYALHGLQQTARDGQEPEFSLISHPELILDRDRTVLLDGRIGQRLAASVADRPELTGGSEQVLRLSFVPGQPEAAVVGIDLDPAFTPAYLATVPGTASDRFAVAVARRAEEPVVDLASLAPARYGVRTSWLQPPAVPLSRPALPAVYGGSGLPEDLDKVRIAGNLVVLSVPADLDWAALVARLNRVAAGRGAAVLVSSYWPEGGGPAPLPQAVAVAAAEDEIAVPTLTADWPTALRLVQQVRNGPTTVSLTGRPRPENRFELVHGVRGQLTGALRYQPRTAALVPVDTAYHDNMDGAYREVDATPWVFDTPFQIWNSSRTAAPARRTEYFTAGRWDLSSLGTGWYDYLSEPGVQFTAGRPAALAWNKAVAGPSTTAAGWAVREGSYLRVAPQMFADSAGRPRMPDGWMSPPDLGSIDLYRDGVWAGGGCDPQYAEFDLPEEPATLDIDARVTRQVASWALSTTVRAQWTFRSAGGPGTQLLPLLTVRFDPALDLRNRAGAGRFAFPAYVVRQDGPATVTGLSVEVSYDAGGSWAPAAVTRSGAGWQVRVDQPAHRYASLRAVATDSAGNRVVQTIIRAYQIR